MRGQKKVSKEKSAPASRPAGSLCFSWHPGPVEGAVPAHDRRRASLRVPFGLFRDATAMLGGIQGRGAVIESPGLVVMQTDLITDGIRYLLQTVAMDGKPKMSYR